MSRTKGSRNKKPKLDATIYVRCRRELKTALAALFGDDRSESSKAVQILEQHIEALQGELPYKKEEKS